MRMVRLAVGVVWLLTVAAMGHTQTAQGPGAKTPSLKKPAQPTLPPARLRKHYDSARNITYVNVDITLDDPRAGGDAAANGTDVNGTGAKNTNPSGTNPSGARTTAAGASGAGAGSAGANGGRSLALVFQLLYKGATTTDLSAAYLFVQATAPAEQPARLSAVKRLDIDADGYLFGYDRADYRTEKVAAPGAGVLLREAAVFQLSPDDLPQLANAGRLAVKFGAETFTINSVQLAELRRTLVSGAE